MVSISCFRSAAVDQRSIGISAVPELPVPMLLMFTANAVIRTGSVSPATCDVCAEGRAIVMRRTAAAAIAVTMSLCMAFTPLDQVRIRSDSYRRRRDTGARIVRASGARRPGTFADFIDFSRVSRRPHQRGSQCGRVPAGRLCGSGSLRWHDGEGHAERDANADARALAGSGMNGEIAADEPDTLAHADQTESHALGVAHDEA